MVGRGGQKGERGGGVVRGYGGGGCRVCPACTCVGGKCCKSSTAHGSVRRKDTEVWSSGQAAPCPVQPVVKPPGWGPTKARRIRGPWGKETWARGGPVVCRGGKEANHTQQQSKATPSRCSHTESSRRPRTYQVQPFNPTLFYVPCPSPTFELMRHHHEWW